MASEHGSLGLARFQDTSHQPRALWRHAAIKPAEQPLFHEISCQRQPVCNVVWRDVGSGRCQEKRQAQRQKGRPQIPLSEVAQLLPVADEGNPATKLATPKTPPQRA